MPLVRNLDYKVKILKSEGDIIERGTDIISFSRESVTWYLTGELDTITTEATGRIHYLVKNGDIIHDNDAVAILSDPLDEATDVLKWYNNQSN